MAGRTELTSQQRRSLAGDGYLLVPSVLAADAVDALAGHLNDLARGTIRGWDATPGEQPEDAGVVSIRLDWPRCGASRHLRPITGRYG